MKVLWRLIARLRGTLSGRRNDSDMAEELESHIQMQTDDNIRSGMSPDEARRAAVLKFGGVESVKESYRDQRGVPFLESVAADLRYAVRQLRHTPGVTITAVIAIALGIGANTAIFSAFNTLVFRPLPVPEPDRLVMLARTSVTDDGATGYNTSASPAEFVHWRAQSSVLEDVSAFIWTGMNYTGGDVVEFWNGHRVSANIFRTFRLPILYGRSFTPEEDLPNGPRVAVISQGLWKRRFASDPSVVGKSISLSGEPYVVVGIAADSPGVLEMQSALTDVYVPFGIDPNTTDVGHTFTVAARLKPGVTFGQAGEQLNASSAEYRAKFPLGLGPKSSFTVKPYHDAILGEEDNSDTIVVVAAMVMVLLIACANVANLLLARGATRSREIGIRVAIGAGRGRVIRQLLTESLVLSLAGGALGLLLGDVGIRALVSSNFTDLPLFWKIQMDWRVLSFALAVSVVTAVIFGMFPALQGLGVGLRLALKDQGRRWGTGFRQNKIRAALVIGEVSLAVVLMIGSALLIRTFISLYRVDRGFETKNVLVMHTSLVGPQYSKTARAADTIRDALTRVRAIPGVLAAGAAGYAPLQGNLGLSFNIVGKAPSDGPYDDNAGWTPVSPGYFDVFKIPVKRGRVFNDRDDGKSAPVVVINESMANKFWKGSDPLNDQIVIGQGFKNFLDGEPTRQIVGIVGDVRQRSLDAAPEPRMYVPQAQLPEATNAWLLRLAPNAWVVRTLKSTHELAVAIQEQLRQATGLPVFEFHSMNEVVSGSFEDRRMLMVVMTIFGCLALLLAAIGIYGVIAYTVEQRTHEIGIRVALGADAAQVRNMVVRHGMGLTVLGVIIGIGAAFELARVMQSLLFGVQPRDPIVFFAVPVLLSAVALLAVWLPATRASRVDPMDSLRCE